jgi:predicted nucleic acid-binding protein
MNDLSSPKLFLDAALIVGILFSENPSESPGYGLFKLGEAGLVDLSTSEDVLRETHGVLQSLLGEDSERVKILLAENLAMGNVALTLPPSDSTVSQCLAITNYEPDAKVLAAAIERGCEVFVTYDKKHLLKNPMLGPPHTRIVVMTGGEAKAWAIDQISVRSRLKAEQNRKR